MTVGRASGVLLVAALALQLIYFSKTNPRLRTYDADGHLEHIVLIIERGPFESSDACWECYQPPFYYVAAAAYSEITYKLFPSLDRERLIQVSALALFFFFLLVGSHILLEQISPPWQLLAVALFLFWPSGVFNSVRIGNDNAFYILHALVLACLLKADQGAPRAFEWAAILAGGAVMTKSNGWLSAVLVSLYVVFKGNKGQILRSLSILGGFVLLFLATGWFKGFVFTNASGMDDRLWSGNSWFNYLTFDLGQYFRPFVNSRLDATGRSNVWIMMLKTSVFGEFSSSQRWVAWLAPSLYGFLLVMVGFGLFGFWKALRRPDRRLFVLNAVLLMAGLLAYRLKWAYGNTADFRYIYPILISGVVFFSDALVIFRERGWNRSVMVGWASAVSFIVLSICTTAGF